MCTVNFLTVHFEENPKTWILFMALGTYSQKEKDVDWKQKFSALMGQSMIH